jgi:hypothetical protein
MAWLRDNEEEEEEEEDDDNAYFVLSFTWRVFYATVCLDVILIYWLCPGRLIRCQNLCSWYHVKLLFYVANREGKVHGETSSVIGL